jgi:hypothetical protein
MQKEKRLKSEMLALHESFCSKRKKIWTNEPMAYWKTDLNNTISHVIKNEWSGADDFLVMRKNVRGWLTIRNGEPWLDQRMEKMNRTEQAIVLFFLVACVLSLALFLRGFQTIFSNKAILKRIEAMYGGRQGVRALVF